jgi:predicted GIY-YIG superfamily endonuclease
MKNLNVSPIVYVLKLENDKYYIGITYNLNIRFAQHLAGEGSKWTKQHKPICIESVFYGGDEKEIAQEWIINKGLENVRGGPWCRLNYKKTPQSLIR